MSEWMNICEWIKNEKPCCKNQAINPKTFVFFVVCATARALLGPGCLVIGNRYKEVKDGCKPQGM